MFAVSHSPTFTKLDQMMVNLNQQQREAVLNTEGPLLILAGAGTGKTRVLTTRLAYILQQGLAHPWQIMAVTFTNKAAASMRSRIQDLIQHETEGFWIGTFHSIMVRILRKHARELGFESTFSILDTDDQNRVLKQIITEEGLDIAKYTPKLIGGIISRWKDKALFPELVKSHDRRADPTIITIYEKYQEQLKILNAVDFGDLLLYGIALFQNHPEILQHYHHQFRYILVDEYQDTNIAQYLWLRLLAQGTPNICCVGDDDQSIYRWRGAEVGNILRFNKDFPNATIIRLEQNYRSTTHILGAATKLIANNNDRLGKELKAQGEGGEKVLIKACWNCDDEARFVGEKIEEFQRQGHSLSEIAILMRAGFQTRQFEERLMTIGVPYAVIGGLRFYERAEIRDALAYLRLVVQPNDALAFERIVNLPRRGIGQAALNTFHQAAKEAGISVPKAARMLLDTKLIKGNAKSNLILFFQMLDSWQEKLPDFKPSELANLILEESGYLEMWRRDPNLDAQQRLDNLKELIRAIDDFENLQGFLEHVSLVLDNADMASGDRVNMMTLHAAKGLEFNTVFLTGWEEGLFPHIRSLDEEGGLEEERRLAYVGLTRARKHAIITYAGFRRLPQGGKPCTPSQFIAELPKEHCVRIHMNGYVDCSSTESFQAKTASKGCQQPFRIASSAPIRPSAQFKVYEKVFHQKFGYGKIIEIDGDTLIIDFETSGRKHIIASFVENA